MRVIKIQSQHLTDLKEQETADRWLVKLTTAGLVRPESVPAPDSPMADIDKMFQGSMALCDLEDEVTRARYSSSRLYLAPKYSIPTVILIYVLSVLWAGQTHDEIDRLWRFGWVWMFLGIVAIGIIVGIKRGAQRREKARLATLARAKEMTSTTRQEVLSARDHLLTRTFATAIRGRLLVHLPHDQWLEQCLRDVPGSQAALREQLSSARDALAARVAELANDPPEDWTDEGLLADHDALCAALQDAGITQAPPQPTG